MRTVFSFLFFIVVSGIFLAGEEVDVLGSELKIKPEIKMLPNGLKVIVLEDPSTLTFTFQVWYKVGSMDEVPGKTGISHLLEHMMFKGTHRYGPGEFSKIVSANGGQENAFTSKDYTAYFENWASGKLEISMELESDRMVNLKLVEEEFQREKAVVMEERRLRTEDDPISVLVEETVAVAYRAHPYKWPVIGWMSDIENIALDDLRDYYKRFYSPSNAVVVVVGDVDKEEVFEKAEKYFGGIPGGVLMRRVEFKEPPQRGEKRIKVRHKEARVPALFGVFHVPNGKSEESYAIKVLSMVLGEGRSSRLYKKLVFQDKNAVSVETSYDPIARGSSVLFEVFATPAVGITLEEVEKAMWDEIERIKNEGPTLEELEKAKNRVISSFIYGLDSNFYRAMLIGMLEVCGFDIDYVNTFVEKVEKVTVDDVMNVAKRYLVRDNYTVGYLVPQDTE